MNRLYKQMYIMCRHKIRYKNNNFCQKWVFQKNFPEKTPNLSKKKMKTTNKVRSCFTKGLHIFLVNCLAVKYALATKISSVTAV